MPEKTGAYWSSRFSIAPMLDWTDRHCRYFLRLLSRNTLLYTEMVTTGAIIHGKGDYLAYSEEEHPVALATISRSPNNWVINFTYGVSPQPEQAPENSNNGVANCEFFTLDFTSTKFCLEER
mgnify:FL=1